MRLRRWQHRARSLHQAHDADPLSSYGGIIAFNRVLDQATAEEIIKTFFEAVIAPGYEDGVVDILHKKEKLRILDTHACGQVTTPWIETISGGFLVQERDIHHLDPAELKVVTETQPDPALLDDLVFAWNVVKHVKSNAIVVAKDGVSIGVGAGQMNRVGSCDIALKHAGDKAKGAVLASDAFFPFADNIEVAAQPGSRRSSSQAGASAIRKSSTPATNLALPWSSQACVTLSIKRG